MKSEWEENKLPRPVLPRTPQHKAKEGSARLGHEGKRGPPVVVGGGAAPAASHPACAHVLLEPGSGQRRASGSADLSLPGTAAAPRPAENEKPSEKAVQWAAKPEEEQKPSPTTLGCGLILPSLLSLFLLLLDG